MSTLLTVLVAVVEKASHPEQRIFRGTLSTIAQIMHDEGIRSTAMIIVSKVLGDNSFVDSKLYDPTFSHACRQARIVTNESE